MKEYMEKMQAEVAEFVTKSKDFVTQQQEAQKEYVAKMQEVIKGVDVNNVVAKQKEMYDLSTQALTKGLHDVVSFNMKLSATALDKAKAVFEFAKHQKN